MYGLINKSVQAFLRDNYGSALWRRVAQRIGIAAEGFEAMLQYPPELTENLIEAACLELDRPADLLLEDIGTYLVSLDMVRRLLRFGGLDYVDFLLSLDELRERGRMALSDLDLPSLVLLQAEGGRFLFELHDAPAGWGAVTAGLLRAMADDYGALAVIDHLKAPETGAERVQVVLLAHDFADDKGFALAQPRAEARP